MVISKQSHTWPPVDHQKRSCVDFLREKRRKMDGIGSSIVIHDLLCIGRKRVDVLLMLAPGMLELVRVPQDLCSHSCKGVTTS